MKFTNAEKLIVTMLADLHEKFEIDNVDTRLIKQAIYSNNTWALSWELPVMAGDSLEPTPPEVSLVVDILDMWSFVEAAYERFNETEKSELEAKAGPLSNHVEFVGFDGNNESQYLSIANFLTKDMKRFTRFADRELNSHCPVIDGHRRMLREFLLIRPKLVNRRLSVEEMAGVLSARRNQRC